MYQAPSKRPENEAYSLSHTFAVTSQAHKGEDPEIHLEVFRTSGPSIADAMFVLSPTEALALANTLIQSITEAEAVPASAVHPTPPADLAQYLYGAPYYGEEQ